MVCRVPHSFSKLTEGGFAMINFYCVYLFLFDRGHAHASVCRVGIKGLSLGVSSLYLVGFRGQTASAFTH